MKRIGLIIISCCLAIPVFGQMQYGTTGLLHSPTAEMQNEKTFMVGVGIQHHSTYRDYWNAHDEYNPYTFNYYVNVTIFPWLELSYAPTLVKGIHGSSYWPQKTWGKFVNQDRSFHGRLRLWKEGWWKDWTPQIVFGANDPGSHERTGGGNIVFEDVGKNTNHLTRFYIAATKHFTIREWGELGVHASVIQFDGLGLYNDHCVTLGANFRFRREGDEFWTRALNGLNVMAELYDGNVNVGAMYSMWEDRFNVVAELYGGKYFSLGFYYKVVLQ